MKNHFGLNATISILLFTVAFLTGCAKLEEQINETIGSYEIPEIDEEQVKTQAASLLEQNQGKAVVTGVLNQESSLSGSLTKVANAQGTSRGSNRAATPLTDADVLFYDATQASTKSAYRTQTDSTGTYYAVLDEGTYFAFAVKFDPLTQELITARVDNVAALPDSVIEVEEVTAIEDEIAPTVTSVYDATSPDASSGVFLLSGVTHTSTRINVVFSEPMDRNSAGGILFGRMDTSAASGVFALADTLESDSLVRTWNGDNTVLNLSFADPDYALELGAQYGIILPTSLKDLARNALEQKFKVTFVPVEAAILGEFKILETMPAKDGSIKPLQTPTIIFNRPVEIFSVLSAVSFDPAIPGVWEILGSKAIFKAKAPLESGSSYTLNIASTARDLNGVELTASRTVSFTVASYTGAAAGTGEKAEIAQRVEKVFDAFKQGDIPTFSGFFHANFRLNEGGTIISRDQFIETIRRDVSERNNLLGGFPAPVFDNDASACDEGVERWKVRSVDSSTTLWVETAVPPGASRRVFLDDADRTQVADSAIQWNSMKPEFTYDGNVYKYDADFSQYSGPVTADGAEDDARFWGDLLKRTSTVVLEEVKGEIIEEFEVDTGIVVASDTARVAARNKSIRSLSRLNFEPFRSCGGESAADTSFGIMKFVLVKTMDNWMIVFVDSPEDLSRDDYNSTVDYDNDFNNFQTIENITPIELLAPVAEAEEVADDNGEVAFSWLKVADSSVGGYIIGMAEDPRYIAGRPSVGVLYFAKQGTGDTVKFTVDSLGKPLASSRASAIARNVFDLMLPGWERTLFEMPVEALVDHNRGYGGVYFWKVIAVADTSAAQFLNNGFRMERFFGESDFKFGQQYGHFSVGPFPTDAQIEFIYSNQMHVEGGGFVGGTGGFGDSDLDGYPDFMEQNYGTDPFNRSSFPDFTLDTDADGMADFLEDMLDDGTQNLVETPADDAALTAQWDRLKTDFGIDIVDSDGDGFPDEVEEMFGYDPFDPNHNPGTRARAEVPTGVFNGLLAFGTDRFDIDFKILKDSTIRVGYTAILKQDTLRDTVRAFFNQSIGEFMFPVRFESGPDAGHSLLLRGHYDAHNSLFMGPMDMIPSVPKTSVDFGGGPYMGDWAASNKIGLDLEQFIGGGGGGAIGPGPGEFGYRFPPPGADTTWQFSFVEDPDLGATLYLVDDFGDTLATFANFRDATTEAHINLFRQPEGGFDVDAHFATKVDLNHEEIHAFGRIFKWRDEMDPNAAEVWVFDGQFNKIQEICDQPSSADSSMCLQWNFKDVPGQFSAKAPLDDITMDTDGLTGTFMGWAVQDEFGTGVGGGGGPDNDGDCVPQDRDPDDMNFDVPTPGGECHLGGGGGFGAPPYLGTGADFRTYLLRQGISNGDTFKIKILGPETVWETVNDSDHITNSHEWECGFVRIFPINDTASRYSGLEMGGNQVILLESSPGVPAFDNKVKDKNGVVVEGGAYITEVRPVNGPQCTGGPGGTGVFIDADLDCVPQEVDPDEGNPDVPTPGGECDFVIPDALAGKEDHITPQDNPVPYSGSLTEFADLVKTYLGFQPADVFGDLNLPVFTLRADVAHTFGGEFYQEDGKIAHAHNFPFFSQSGTWFVVESQARPGEPAITIGPDGPAVLLMAAPPNDDISEGFTPFRAPIFVVEDFIWELFGVDSATFHLVVDGAITSSLKSGFDFEGYPGEFTLVNAFGVGADSAATVMSPAMDPGRPAVVQDSNGITGIVVSVFTRDSLDNMSGGGSIGDLDGDCVPAHEDPDDNNFDIPVQGGRCGGGGPVPFQGDIGILEDFLQQSGGMIRKVTFVGDPGIEVNVGITAQLTADANTGAIVVADPVDPGMKLVFIADGMDPMKPVIIDGQPAVVPYDQMFGTGGGGEDLDGDCVPAHDDPDDNNFDVPFVGGNCGGGQGPDVYSGELPQVEQALTASGGMVLKVESDTDPGVPVDLGTTPRLFHDQMRGMVIAADPADSNMKYVFMGESSDPSVLFISNGQPVVVPEHIIGGGGGGGGGGEMDKDGDCVPESRDPDDMNFDIPTVGGECTAGGGGTDADGDCVPAGDDPDDTDPDIPMVGGQCTPEG